MYRYNQIKLKYSHNEKEFQDKIAKSINVHTDGIDWSSLVILKKSIDARDKENI